MLKLWRFKLYLLMRILSSLIDPRHTVYGKGLIHTVYDQGLIHTIYGQDLMNSICDQGLIHSDPELGACLFYKRRQELGEYSADGGDQASFGVVGGHVGDVLDIWPNEVVQWVQIRGEGGPCWAWLAWGSLSSQSRSGLFGTCRTYTSSPPSHMHSQLCVRCLNLWQSAE